MIKRQSCFIHHNVKFETKQLTARKSEFEPWSKHWNEATFCVSNQIKWFKICWQTSAWSLVSNCDDVVFEIKFQWLQEGLNCETLELGRPMQEIRSSNSPVVTGICDPNKSRARYHPSFKISKITTKNKKSTATKKKRKRKKKTSLMSYQYIEGDIYLILKT